MQTRDVISLISKIREKVNRFIVTEMESHGIEGIATSHGDIFWALFQNKQLSMAEIADRIDKDKSTVTVLVDKLVRFGYVVKARDAVDTRVFHVALTQKGEALRPAFEEISNKLLEVFYQDIPEEEKEELLRVLSKIYGNL